jgi:hypothetical protein
MNFIKSFRVFLLILIVVGIGLLVTQKIWVSKVVDMILKSDNKAQFVPIILNIKDEINKTLTPQGGLPPLVEAKRQAIYIAAISRDYEKLNKETSKDFQYSFGGDYEDGFIGYLKLAEKNYRESAFDIMPTLLRLPYTKRGNLYTWPSVFDIEPSKWTSEDIRMMQTFLTEEQIESYRQYGGYMYYRLGITSLGDWIFYVAGD